MMEPRLSLITLGVRDLARARAFYQEGLGFPLSSMSQEDVAFFKLRGTVLALWSWERLAEDAQVQAAGSGFRGFALAYNARTREEVDQVLALAAAAGGTITKPAETVFWGGYSGYFADPEGYLWEVAWGPDFTFTEEGHLILP